MHLHFCPQDLLIVMMLIDHITMYYYHYKHIVLSVFTNDNGEENCEVCLIEKEQMNGNAIAPNLNGRRSR